MEFDVADDAPGRLPESEPEGRSVLKARAPARSVLKVQAEGRNVLKAEPEGRSVLIVFVDTNTIDEEGRMFTRTKVVPAPEVGAEAPEFSLPSAQGGQLRLSMRTVKGPVVVAFYRPGDEEDVEYFKLLAEKEDEINLASGSIVAIGVAEPTQARNFARASGLKSYVLYDYARVASRQWGLLERDKREGDFARPAVFIVGPDRYIAHAWTEGRPEPEELLARVSEITGLPKPPEDPEEDKQEDAKEDEKPKKMSAEEREKIKAERRAAREAGKSLKTAPPSGEQAAPQKMTAEERQRIKAERRAAREAGKSLKQPANEGTPEPPSGGSQEEA